MDMEFDLKIAALQSNADYWESQTKFILATMDVETRAILEQHWDEGMW